MTGATRGIGLAIAQRLKGVYRVIGTGRNHNSIEACKQTFGDTGDARLFDLASRDSIENLVREIRETYGERAIYGLVNNAAVCETTPLGHENFSSVWDRVVGINLAGTAHLTQEMVRQGLFAQDASRIVNISSQLGKVGRAGYSAYGASKFGLIGLTEVWSRELASRGATVNAVCPGWIQTDMTDEDLARQAERAGVSFEDYKTALLAGLDQRRFNTPEEVAGIVAFLLSDEGSGVTGRTIEMAGPSA